MRKECVVDLPAEYHGREDVIDVAHEEEALCWLWAFPSLWPWKLSVAWLYTPVVGKKRWPGDLWGIDSNGDLLILEAKRCRGRYDAFIDFADFHRDGREELSAGHWRTKWHSHWEAELAFPDSVSERPQGHTDGNLPRSNKRKHIRLWRVLAGGIRHHIESDGYVHQVEQNLRRREVAGNPSPFYFGLFIEMQGQRRRQIAESTESACRLQCMVGSDRVIAVSISCRRER